MNKRSSDGPWIHFMVALPCEAKPLIKGYRVSRIMDEKVFPVYRNDLMTLTLTGPGKTAMAAGVAYTHAIFEKASPSLWLNIGIAGHPDIPLGQPCLAHKITDQDREKSWYPPLIEKAPCRTEALLTRSTPETAYTRRTLYDMEASGFYETASRFSSSELVQCFKVVSDNRACPADQLEAEQVTELIENQLDAIGIMIDRLRRLAVISDQPHLELLEKYCHRWRFSAQQSVQLQSLLHRWILLDREHCPLPEQLNDLKSGSGVLAHLREKVDRLPLVFP